MAEGTTSKGLTHLGWVELCAYVFSLMCVRVSVEAGDPPRVSSFGFSLSWFLRHLSLAQGLPGSLNWLNQLALGPVSISLALGLPPCPAALLSPLPRLFLFLLLLLLLLLFSLSLSVSQVHDRFSDVYFLILLY